MTHRETLDEAIDRVATGMTQSGDAAGGEIPRIWLAASPRAGRLAMGIAGAAAVVLALVMLRMQQVDEQRSVPPVEASALVAWSPLPRGAGAGGQTSPAGRSGRPLGRPSHASMVRLKAAPTTEDPTTELRARSRAPSEREARPAWGIPFIEAPAALAVPAPTVAQLEIDAVDVEAIELEPLTMSPIEAGVRDSEAFDFAQPKEQ